MEINFLHDLLYGEDFRINYYGEDDCRIDFYYYHEIKANRDRKKIFDYLKKLEKNGDDYKIKNIKKLYKIYNVFHQIKSLIYRKDTFEYTDKDLSIDDFYNFLVYVIDCIKADINKFIDLIQNDDFNNDEILSRKLYQNK